MLREYLLFPARAGMNRGRHGHAPRVPAVPRTRGDEPNILIRTAVGSLFPARAGMNRLAPSSAGRAQPVPRTRGDEPTGL